MEAHFGALYAGGHLEEGEVQIVGVHTVAHIDRIAEESAHGLLVDGVAFAEILVVVHRLFRVALLIEGGILQVHVIHVVLTGIGLDNQPRFVLHQL